MAHVHMECHSVIKNEIMPYAEKCMKLEGMVSSPMWNPDPTHTDTYRYTQDPSGELLGAQGPNRRKENRKRSAGRRKRIREDKGR